VPIDPADIRAQEFRVTFRGYDIGEVDAFLDWIEEELSRPSGVRVPSGAAPAGPGADAAGLRAAASAEEQGTPSAALRTLLHAERMAEQILADHRAPRSEVDDLVARGRRLRAELDRVDESERRCREELRTWLDEHERLLDAPPHPVVGEIGDRPVRAHADTTVRRVTTTLPFTAVR
jgi:cell division initiation protein